MVPVEAALPYLLAVFGAGFLDVQSFQSSDCVRCILYVHLLFYLVWCPKTRKKNVLKPSLSCSLHCLIVVQFGSTVHASRVLVILWSSSGDEWQKSRETRRVHFEHLSCNFVCSGGIHQSRCRSERIVNYSKGAHSSIGSVGDRTQQQCLFYLFL